MNKQVRKIQSPFGVFAVYGLLFEGIAATALLSPRLNDWHVTAVVSFLLIFPVIVFGCFMYLLTKQTGKLYGPADYSNSSDFFKAIQTKVDASVGKVSIDAESQMAALDIELIPFWERKNHPIPEDSMKKLALLEQWVIRLEKEVKNANPIDKASHISALREIYLKYLEQARLCHASGQRYQNIRERVIEGLNNISNQAT